MTQASAVGTVAEVESPPAGSGVVARMRHRAALEARGLRVSSALRFYHEVVGLEHLHYGLWNGEPRTLDGLRRAQQRYAEHLLDWIPDGVGSILDVGCGTGATTELLHRRGYRVEGLSPDPYQARVFGERVGLPFHLMRFHELAAERRYDLVLMSESAQYIWLERLFSTARRAAAGGHLLISDYFSLETEGKRRRSSGHRLDEFLAAAADLGFEVVRREDVTDQVTPTLDLAAGWLERWVEPSGRWLAARHPVLSRIGRFVVPSLDRRYADLKRQVDSGEFTRSKRYLVILFRVPPAEPACSS